MRTGKTIVLVLVLICMGCAHVVHQKRNGLWYLKKTPYSGVDRVYYENNQLQREGNFLNGQLHGKWVTWHRNGVMKSVDIYQEDIRNGAFRAWYSNGQVRVAGTYSNGLLDGHYESYFSNGISTEAGNYVNGVPEGEWGAHYENGNLRYSGTYRNGEQTGWWTVYNADGTINQMYYCGER